MPRNPRAYLWDILEAAQAIQAFTQTMDVAEYKTNDLVQAAVERKFEIIGEALNQLTKVDPVLASRIPDVPQIIAFRNQLIHGYATVQEATVWNITRNALPRLIASVQRIENELRQQDSLS